MTSTLEQELATEQTYFDEAAEEREKKRATLLSAPAQAAGPIAAASAVRRGAQKVLAELGDPDDPVAFGRFDTQDGEKVYIGKHLITNDARDALVINWQAPYAEPYFTAHYDDPCGLVRRRKYTTQRNRVKTIEEAMFEDLARRVGELTGLEQAGIDDTVLRDLEKHRTGEMQDIVQTIHASQYLLVRSPLEQLLIIQGGPGTGKTAVALHRVSWLLFNHRQQLTPADVLVVGPNPTFTRYIKSVLPGLGDNDVAHRDLRTLGPQPSTARREDDATARLKGDARMSGLLYRALRERVRVPDRVEWLDLAPGVRFSASDLTDVLRRFTHLPYGAGRTAARRHLAEQATRAAGGATVDPNTIDNALERIWPSFTPQSFLRELLASRDRLLSAAGDDFTAGEVARLIRTAAERISDETWSDADVALLDEIDSLVNGDRELYAHLVVDEAQDLSPMQLRSLRRRSPDGSMTVVGDLAQSTGAWARDSWDDVQEALQKTHPVSLQELEFGYRVPKQVFDLAARLLPEAAPGVAPPRVVRHGPTEPQLEEVDVDDVVLRAVAIAREQAGSGRFVGVVVPDSLREQLLDDLRKREVVFSDASTGTIGKSINVVSPGDAKGLEFDAVVVLEPERIVEEHDRGLRMLYVALTRTTQHLAVVHSGRLLPLEQDEPPATDLLAPAVDEVDAGDTLETTIPEHHVHASTQPGPPAEQAAGAVEGPTPAEQPGQVVPEPPPASEPLLETPLAAAPPPATADGGLGDLGDVVVAAAASQLANGIRSGVPEPLWARLLDRVRSELGLRDDA